MTRHWKLLLIVFALLLLALLLKSKPAAEVAAVESVPVSTIASNPSEAPQPPNPESPASRTDSQPHELTNEEAYCRLVRENIALPLTGELKMFTQTYGSDEDDNPGFFAWVYSSDCPPNTFSKVQVDAFGRIKELVDCRHSSPEALRLRSGVQGAAEEQKVGSSEIKLSIYREGFFVLRCGDRTILSRIGDFKVRDGRVYSGDCLVMNKEGRPFEFNGEALDETACTTKGNCLAIVYPNDPNGVRFLDRTSLETTSDPFASPVRERKVFLDSLENLNDPLIGPLGPDWNELPTFSPPKCT